MLLNRSKLRLLMENCGTNIKELAGAIGIHPYTMGKKISGVALFDENEIKALCDYFKVTPEYLLK